MSIALVVQKSVKLMLCKASTAQRRRSMLLNPMNSCMSLVKKKKKSQRSNYFASRISQKYHDCEHQHPQLIICIRAPDDNCI